MRKLKCHEESCMHNSNYYCVKDGIDVDKDAICISYEKSNQAFLQKAAYEFASDFDGANPSPKIKCDDQECVHNDNCKCKADSVEVSHRKGAQACCRTFKPQ